jgi:hypothetical protein
MAYNISIPVYCAIFAATVVIRVLPTAVKVMAARIANGKRSEGIVELVEETSIPGGI